jgi:CMP-N-acetylneuraminic acid synthetase
MLDIPAHGACTMIRTDVLKELGGYRTDLGAQDGFDFWTKVLNRYKCGNVNVPLFYYRRHGKNLTSSSQRIFRARRAIKKDASAAIRQDEGRTIAVIPCRKYYDFTTDLWSKPLADNSGSLLDISIKRCLASDEIDLVIVSSDNLEVQSVVKQYQHPKLRFHQRQSKDTLRSRPISIAIKDMIRTFDLKDEDIIVLSYLQAPFTTIESLREAVDTMVMNEADSAFAIKEITDTVYQRTAHGLNSINYRGQLKADFDILYRDARVSTAFKVGNLKHGSINGSRRVHFVVPDAETHFIENKEDFNIARALFQIRKEEDQ